ncbi:MAG TPA: hypothetical protein VII15_05320 [Candidatus Cryosericum sp.]
MASWIMDPSQQGRLRKRMDLFDCGVLVVLAVVSVWPMIVLNARQGPNAIWNGTDGILVSDQMNYLGWIQVAAKHVLISDPFTTARSAADYLHPGLAISGLLVRLGMTPTMAYLVWEPVAVVVLFVGLRRYVRASLVGIWPRRLALVLSLFYISPAGALVAWLNGPHWSNFFLLQPIDVEMWPVGGLWGYPFTAIAIGAMVLCLLAYERDRRSLRIRPAAPLLALLCAWLQPWQGATLIAMVVVTELTLRLRGDRVRLALPAMMLSAIAAPLVYYSVLSHLDSTWQLAGRVNLTIFPAFPWEPILISIAPLALLSALAYWLPIAGFHDLALRVWPISALTLYGIIGFAHIGTFPLHSLQGIGIPLAVLGVMGARKLHFPVRNRSRIAIASVVVALLVIPSGLSELHSVWGLGSSPTLFGPQPVFVTADEREALNYLREDRAPGAVLTPYYLGQTIPAETGRHTWLGSFSWTPDFFKRITVANDLFSGRLSPSSVNRVVRSSTARFLLSDCNQHADLSSVLRPILGSVRHFGCATVYQLRPGE